MRVLLRLYPRSWRERYGDEFEAVLEQRPLRLRDVMDIVRGGLDARFHHSRSSDIRRKGITMLADRDELRNELHAILAARRDLGDESEEDLVETFLDRLEQRGISAHRTASIRHQRPADLRVWQWSLGSVVLWLVMGLSSIAVGVPWSLGSTAPKQVFAASVVSGYTLVLLVLLFVFSVLSAFRIGAMLVRRSRQTRAPALR